MIEMKGLAGIYTLVPKYLRRSVFNARSPDGTLELVLAVELHDN